MRGVACLLLILSSAVLLLSCASMGGTPMQSNNCRYLPSVQECQAAADQYIEDECLLDCVRHLYAVGKVKCGEEQDIPQYCATRQAEGDEVGGYVPRPLPHERRSCTQPREGMS